MIATHGACFLTIKTEGKIQERVLVFLAFSPLLVMILFALGGVLLESINSYKIVKFAGTLAPSDPLSKKVIIEKGNWINNYQLYHWMMIAPILGIVGEIATFFFVRIKSFGKAFISHSVAIFGIISTVGLTLFPFILPSSFDPNASLTIWDASSSEFTLWVMLIAAIIFVPIIIFYASWVFMVLRGKVTDKTIEKDSKFLY